jgi:hypothetical protein
MSATVHVPARSWARVHRAALAIILLSLALAASLGVLAARLVSTAVPVPPASVSTVHLQPTDNGCQVARPGQPC